NMTVSKIGHQKPRLRFGLTRAQIRRLHGRLEDDCTASCSPLGLIVMHSNRVSSNPGLISGVNVSVAGGLIGGFAAETGTKTMPDSSVAPPRAYRSYFNYVHPRRHECALPSSRCGNKKITIETAEQKQAPLHPVVEMLTGLGA